MFFRKKPVVIQAVQYDGSGLSLEKIRAMGTGNIIDVTLDNTLLIPTLEGMMEALKGDFVIKGIKGEIYPCKPDVFVNSYEQV
jgi:hypothetical protein